MDFQDSMPIKYSVLIWNDEKHSFSDLIAILENAFGFSRQIGYECACRVDSIGRDVVQTSDNLEFLVQSLRFISSSNIKTSIAPSKVVFREYIATYLLNWLINLIQHPGNISRFAKEILSQELAKELVYEYKSNQEMDKSARSLMVGDSQHLRIDLLLTLSHDLWKIPSKQIIQLIIGIFVMNGDDLKKWVATRFASLYIKICKEYCSDEKPFDLTILSLSVQLFNSPNVVSHLLNHTNIFRDCLLILKATLFPLFDNRINLEHDFEQSIELVKNLKLPRYSQLSIPLESYGKIKYDDFLSNLNYLIISWKRSGGKDIFQISLGKNAPLDQFLDILLLLQGCNLQKRAIVMHVEFDTNDWVFCFSFLEKLVHTVLIPLTDMYCALETFSPKLFLYLVSEIMDKILNWSLHDHWHSLYNKGSMERFQSRSMTGFHHRGISETKYYIPNRNILVQPASFLHPLHWMMAFLLVKIPSLMSSDEAATEFFTHLIGEIFHTEEKPIRIEKNGRINSVQELGVHLALVDRMLLVFNHPIEAIALASQIRAGLWVRNGTQIRNQAIEFKERSLRECYDHDFFLVQFSFTIFEPSLILTVILDKFAILEWFQLTPNHLDPFDADKILFVVQDCIHFLICLLSERLVLLGTNSENILKREIIHQLAAHSAGITFSKLFDNLKPLGVTCNSDSFKLILNTVAIFKPPETYSASGLYSLKEQFLYDVDPWFFHYDRNQREEVERLQNSKLQKEGIQPIMPKICPFTKLGIFKNIDLIVVSLVFMEILLFGFWKICKPILESDPPLEFSEDLFSHFLQLLNVGLSISSNLNSLDNHKFMNNFLEVKIEVETQSGSTVHLCLLEIFMGLLDREDTKELRTYAGRLNVVGDYLKQNGGNNVKDFLTTYETNQDNIFPFRSQKFTKKNEAQAQIELDRRSAANLARKKAILAQFAIAQSSFMEKYDLELSTIEVDDLEVTELANDSNLNENVSKVTEWKYPSGNCIICQEEVLANNNPYGLLSLIQKSMVDRYIDFIDHENISEIAKMEHTLDRPSKDKIETVYPGTAYGLKNGFRMSKPTLHATTCGHLMHFKCLENYRASILKKHHDEQYRVHPENLFMKEYLCPLCKTLGNTLIPILWSGKLEYELKSRAIDCSDDLFEDYFYKYLKSTFSSLITEVENQTSGDELAGVVKEIKIASDLETGRDLYHPYFFQTINALDPVKTMDSRRQKFDIIVKTLEIYISTLSGIEIFLRGCDAAASRGGTISTGTFIDSLTPQHKSLLRVLSETAQSSISALFGSESHHICNLILEFLQDVVPNLSRKTGPSVQSPLIGCDGFSNLARVSVFIIPRSEEFVQALDMLKWVRYFAMFEVFKTLVSVIEVTLIYGSKWINIYVLELEAPLSEQLDSLLGKLVGTILYSTGLVSKQSFLLQNLDQKVIIHLCKANLLIFMRRTLLLLYIQHGIVPAESTIPIGDTEFERLLKRLELPSLEDLLISMTTANTKELMEQWCANIVEENRSHWVNLGDINSTEELGMAIPKTIIIQPQVYKLVTLPSSLNELIDWALSTTCLHCSLGK